MRKANVVLKIALDINEYTDSRVCADCGGDCCKWHAGLYYPADLEPLTAESLAERFRSGLYAVDWWEGDIKDEHDELHNRVYFIRPRHEGVKRLRDPALSGRCVRLTDTGCDLPFRKRPTQCRALKPCCCKDLKPCGNDCEGTVSKRDTALAWIPYQQLIADAELLFDNHAHTGQPAATIEYRTMADLDLRHRHHYHPERGSPMEIGTWQ